MRFIDHCRIKVVAGDGGNGVVAFRREKFIPFGGPSGGDGGRGANITLLADEGLSTLQDVTYQRTITGDRGGHGQGSDMYGRGGVDRVEKVPIGTQVFDDETGELLGDMIENGQQLLVAKGGQGGRGNIHFASSFDRAPRRAEKGERGESRTLRLELKIMADVGLLGFPNVGKSTFVSSVSAARPKIADYPFTTMVPSLGVVQMHGGQRLGGSSFVIADIPGLIPGASEGTGLGIEFLKHVERTRVLLHLVSLDFADGREPLADYLAIREELAKFSPELCQRPEVVALSKMDIPEVREAYPELAKEFARHGVILHSVSAATRDGLDELLTLLQRVVRGQVPPEDLRLPVAAPKTGKKTTATVKSKPAVTEKPAPKKTAPKKAAPAKAAPAKKPSVKTKATPAKAANKATAPKTKPLEKTKAAKAKAKAKSAKKAEPAKKFKSATASKPAPKSKVASTAKPIKKAKATKSKPTKVVTKKASIKSKSTKAKSSKASSTKAAAGKKKVLPRAKPAAKSASKPNAASRGKAAKRSHR